MMHGHEPVRTPCGALHARSVASRPVRKRPLAFRILQGLGGLWAGSCELKIMAIIERRKKNNNGPRRRRRQSFENFAGIHASWTGIASQRASHLAARPLCKPARVHRAEVCVSDGQISPVDRTTTQTTRPPRREREGTRPAQPPASGSPSPSLSRRPRMRRPMPDVDAQNGFLDR
jgi:hypothetical protein